MNGRDICKILINHEKKIAWRVHDQHLWKTEDHKRLLGKVIKAIFDNSCCYLYIWDTEWKDFHFFFWTIASKYKGIFTEQS